MAKYVSISVGEIMLGFIVALETEAQSFLENVTKIKKSTLSGKTLFTGKYFGEDVAIIISNIGKVSAALSAQALIDKFSPKALINFGSAGGVKGETEICGFYSVTESAQYDFDLTALEPVPLGYNQGYDTVFFRSATYNTSLKRVKLASADKFTSKKEDVDALKNMGCSVFDMEGAAIAQVAKSNEVPVVIIKAVSDIYGSGSNAEQFKTNLKTIGERFPNILEKEITAFLKDN